MTKVYLASPWFRGVEPKMYEKILAKMRAEGYEVYAPIEHEVRDAWEMSNADWGKQVFDDDVKALDNADEVWVLNFGMYSDSGTAWECGYAYGKGKVVKQLVYATEENTEFSLMMLNGCATYDTMSNYLNNEKKSAKIEQKQKKGVDKPLFLCYNNYRR